MPLPAQRSGIRSHSRPGERKQTPQRRWRERASEGDRERERERKRERTSEVSGRS